MTFKPVFLNLCFSILLIGWNKSECDCEMIRFNEKCVLNLESKELKCTNLSSFNELSFWPNRTYRSIVLESNQHSRVKLDKSLNLTGLKLEQGIDPNGLSQIPLISLANIDRFDPFYNPFLAIQSKIDWFDLVIKNSNLTFEAFECEQLGSEDGYLFSDLRLRMFKLEYPLFDSSNKLCPLLFQNSRIQQWVCYFYNKSNFCIVIKFKNKKSNVVTATIKLFKK
jgi:hypothetical protein